MCLHSPDNILVSDYTPSLAQFSLLSGSTYVGAIRMDGNRNRGLINHLHIAQLWSDGCVLCTACMHVVCTAAFRRCHKYAEIYTRTS